MASSLIFSDNDSSGCFPNLTYQERLLGFGGCFLIGTLINIMSFGSFGGILVGKPEKFAIAFTLGNIVSILGTSFLVGFKKQLKSMTDKTRRITTIIYILSIIGVIVSALILKIALLVLMFLVIEFCSYVWYTASYIPFARDCLKKTFRKCIKNVN